MDGPVTHIRSSRFRAGSTTPSQMFTDEYVVKTYTRWDRNEAESEWRGLTLLDRHGSSAAAA
jgi:hypothetical protein